MVEKSNTPDILMGLMILGFCAPILLGVVTGVIFGDFSAGAGAGAIFMVGTWAYIALEIMFGQGEGE